MSVVAGPSSGAAASGRARYAGRAPVLEVDDLHVAFHTREGVVRAAGVSVNRWEPGNVLETLRTGQIDAVQVIYNVFDQAPEDELFAAMRQTVVTR